MGLEHMSVCMISEGMKMEIVIYWHGFSWREGNEKGRWSETVNRKASSLVSQRGFLLDHDLGAEKKASMYRAI